MRPLLTTALPTVEYLVDMVARYRPATRFEGSILVLHATDGNEASLQRWERHATGAVRVVRLPWDHDKLAMDPYIGDVANALRSALTPAVAQPADADGPGVGQP
jgi:hypothetical protein